MLRHSPLHSVFCMLRVPLRCALGRLPTREGRMTLVRFSGTACALRLTAASTATSPCSAELGGLSGCRGHLSVCLLCCLGQLPGVEYQSQQGCVCVCFVLGFCYCCFVLPCRMVFFKNELECSHFYEHRLTAQSFPSRTRAMSPCKPSRL